MAISSQREEEAQRAKRRLLPDDNAERRLVTRAELASCLGVTPSAIDGYVRRGCPLSVPATGKGRGAGARFFLPDVLDWRRERQSMNPAARGAPDDVSAELNRRVLYATTRVAELELARKRGELATLDEFTAALKPPYAIISARLKSSAPRHALAGFQVHNDQDRLQRHAAVIEQLLLHLGSNVDEGAGEESGDDAPRHEGLRVDG